MAMTKSARRYPTKADITRALDAARRLNLKIDGFEVGPRGVIRVFVDAPASSSSGSAFDEWKALKARKIVSDS
jgi:hypothetical protein